MNIIIEALRLVSLSPLKLYIMTYHVGILQEPSVDLSWNWNTSDFVLVDLRFEHMPDHVVVIQNAAAAEDCLTADWHVDCNHKHIF